MIEAGRGGSGEEGKVPLLEIGVGGGGGGGGLCGSENEVILVEVPKAGGGGGGGGGGGDMKESFIPKTSEGSTVSNDTEVELDKVSELGTCTSFEDWEATLASSLISPSEGE